MTFTCTPYWPTASGAAAKLYMAELFWRVSVQAAVFLLVRLLPFCSAAHLKVGIFNTIPDLDRDRLSSYERMIESGFNVIGSHTVDIEVDPLQYHPYGDLQAYLSADSFDVIEMDTYNLRSAVEKNLVVELSLGLSEDLLPASVDSVTIDGRVYGYPTIVCGTFLTSFSPEFQDHCRLAHARKDHTALLEMLEQCTEAMVSNDAHDWERLVGGRMNYDGIAWYPELLYLDGYIDIHGSQSLDQALNDLLQGVVDSTLCERLSHFVGHCTSIRDGYENKCFDKHNRGYFEDLSNVFRDLEEYRTYLYFGFLEKIAYVNPESQRVPVTTIPVAMGEQNNLLLFTDALVINRARWSAANPEKQTAIKDFIYYFTRNRLRDNIAMGVDLHPPRPRWLLQASESFYKHTTDPLYRSLYPALRQAVAAPSLTTDQSSIIHNTLTKSCFNISELPTPLRDSRHKQEL